MSGNEIIGKEELQNLKDIFTKSNGVLFSHSFHERRKKYIGLRYLKNF